MIRRLHLIAFNPLHFQRQSLCWLRTKPTPRSFHHKYKNDDDEDDEGERRNRRAKKIGTEADFHLNKSMGQHILTNPRILDTIIQKSNIKPTDTVLEIGPGTGNLTLKLLQVAAKVVVVEIDKRMIDILKTRLLESKIEDHKITIICQDALKTDFPYFDLVVANIPYGISSPLIAKFVFGEYQFRSATLLLQKEFASRLLAKPGDSEYNRLAVNVKLVADVEFVVNVSKKEFVPCPRIDSSVVKIHPKSHIPNVDMNEWRAFTLTCFSKKNKTLGATFKQKKKVLELFRRSEMSDDIVDNGVTYLNCVDGNEEEEEEEGEEEDCSPLCSEIDTGLFKSKIIQVLKEGGFEDKRPSKLSNEELLRLLSLFNQTGIYFYHQEKKIGGCKQAYISS